MAGIFICKNWTPIFKFNLLVLSAGFLIFGFANLAQAQWENKYSGIKETYAKIVILDPNDSNAVYAATDYFLYASRDGGKSWQEIFVVGGKGNIINFVAVSFDKQPVIYVATTNGLYLGQAAVAGAYKRVYSGAGPAENMVNCIALDKKNPDLVYIATDKGVFVWIDHAKSWKCISMGLGALSVKYIVVQPQAGAIYIASPESIFKSEDNGSTWKNVYTMLKADTAADDFSEEAIEENEEAFAKISCLLINPKNPDEIYAATSKGVLVSKDKGKEWIFMTRLGLDASDIKYIGMSQDGENIYAANYKGVFLFNQRQHRWIELYKGETFRDARFLGIDDRVDAIWAATADGVFKAPQPKMSIVSEEMTISQEIRDRFKYEPSIIEVHRAAIKYAEVHPSKIQNWRNQARIKALLPDLDLSYDKTVSVSTANNNFVVGPKDWGVGLSWDIGSLIFNDDQTNIDVRSRLMVQLRDDILDDVTRLYYERRRLQVDMMLSPPKTDKEKYDKLLRLEELAAGIDALTGGYFSSAIAQRRDT